MRKRPIALAAVLVSLIVLVPEREAVIPVEDARITAAGTWDDGRSMDEVARADYVARAGWWDFAHWLLMNNPNRTRAITFGGERRRR